MSAFEYTTPDFKTTPYWWEDVDQSSLQKTQQTDLPAKIDVLIIGSGYTGVSASIQTIQHGMSTLVIDAHELGFGCSTRNGGQVAPGFKPEFSTLQKRHGAGVATAIEKAGEDAFDYVETQIRDNQFQCGWQKNGRYAAAHTPKQFELLKKEVDHVNRDGVERARLIHPHDQQHELNSPIYFGGAIDFRNAGIHPAQYYVALFKQAQQLGVLFQPHCKALSIERTANGFVINTIKGKITAAKLLLATNGYSGELSPWHQRRIIPIGSYMLATESLSPELVRSLIPNDRMVWDTRKVIAYFRTSPDKTRLIFGGRAALSESDPFSSLPRLYQMMTKVFPQLMGVKVSHAWMGYVAYTFDEMPHIGVHNGVHYCMGYCGSGIATASYFGMRAGLQIAGSSEGKTPLDNLRFSTRPLYYGKPWFLAPAIFYYKILDSILG